MVNTGHDKYSSQFLGNAKSKIQDKSQRRTMRTISESLLYKHNEKRGKENAAQVTRWFWRIKEELFGSTTWGGSSQVKESRWKRGDTWVALVLWELWQGEEGKLRKVETWSCRVLHAKMYPPVSRKSFSNILEASTSQWGRGEIWKSRRKRWWTVATAVMSRGRHGKHHGGTEQRNRNEKWLEQTVQSKI